MPWFSIGLLQDGELVMFTEVEGMAELNTHKPIKVKNVKVRAHHAGSLTMLDKFISLRRDALH